MPHVLCLRAIHPDAIALMKAAPGVTVEVLDPVTPETLAARIPEADAVTVRLTRIDAPLIALARNLRIVARHGVGYDAVDVPALTARGIPLTITPEANAGSVAEHALMLMLACARRVTGYDQRLRDLGWGTVPDMPTVDLAGRTVLIVGFGRIGTRVAKLCSAFGMNISVVDPAVPYNTIKGLGYTPVEDLRAALATADVVTLHCPGAAENRGMVDAGFLGTMRKGAILINTARGTLVDEAALADALRSGQVSAAGLDVFTEEPMVASNPVLALPNAIITPHSAAGTAEGMRRMAMSCAESILARFAGTLDPHVVVNPEVLRRNA
ncbi:hydroxyacid dehydrogenase [Elioraea sp.]|uniref:hydroxyacid dehydrogenase n=1 Tax=Elioraea sp. TaxID=2185103 RepID=UPI0025BBD412|nr:hydroxyacid dehydrogenase [Elioraea sp.]